MLSLHQRRICALTTMPWRCVGAWRYSATQHSSRHKRAYQFQGRQIAYEIHVSRFLCRHVSSRVMSVGLYADTCRHVSQYFACNFRFGCYAVRLDLCVTGKKQKVVIFGVYIAVFRCQFSRPGPLSIALRSLAMSVQHKPGDTASRPRMPEGSPQQNQTGPVRSEVCHFGVLLPHTYSLSSCVISSPALCSVPA